MRRYLLCLILSFISITTTSFAGHIFDIEIPFAVGAQVKSVLPDGRSFDIGRVAMLPETTRWPSYTASSWGAPGTVAASAVNAVHLLLAVENGKGRTMSIIPRETIAPAAGAGASIVIETKAGRGIFGAWAPPAGSRSSVRTGMSMRALTDSLPSHGDTVVIAVDEDSMPYMVDFENRPGGRVIAWTERGPSVIARVVRRVGGCGRFAGTLFQDAGRIRANHYGVIDVSTCPYGETGGFQIIPLDHMLTSTEMQGSWNATQWMIVAREDGADMGGTAPLFFGGLVPGPSTGEEMWDVWSTSGRRPLVMARINGGDWQKFPTASGKNDTAFANVTHIRIHFPFTREPQSAH